MCLAVPAKIISREEYIGVVDVAGVTRKVSLMLVPDVKEGDFVLIHAGFAIETVEEEEAGRILELLQEIRSDEK
jgi:hydrogenase expression/formation protein HypC